MECFRNVKVIKSEHSNLKELRDNGFIKNTIDSLLLDTP